MASQESQTNLLNASQVEPNHTPSKPRKEKSKHKKGAQSKQNPATQIQKQPEAKNKQEPLTKIEKQPETQIKQDPVAKVEKQPEAQVKQDPIAKVEKQPETQVKQDPIAKVEKQPEAQVKQDPIAKVEKQPETQVKQGPIAKVEKQPETQVKQGPIAKVEKQPETQVKQDPIAKVEKQPEAQVKLEPVAKIKVQPEAHVKQEPKLQLKEQELQQNVPEVQIQKEPEAKIQKVPEGQIKKEPETQIKEDPVAKVKKDPDTPNVNLGEDNTNDDMDVDLSAVQIASSLLEQTLALDDPEFDIPEGQNEAYKNIMGLCSSSTENIKKSIYEILNSRENVEISEEDPTTVLQESLNKKMEDFKKVISGCMDSPQATSSNLDSNEQTSILSTEILEEKEPSPEKQVDCNIVVSEKVTNEDAKKLPSPNMAEDLNPGEQSDNNSVATPKNKSNKAAKGKPKNNNVNDSNVDANIVATKLDETPGKTNAKPTKVIEKKPDIPADSPSPSLKPLSSILEARKSEKEALRNSISPDDERFARKQRNVAAKKKGEKTYDQILKSLGNGTAEEKLHLLCKKHVDALDEFRLMEPRLKQLERQYLIQQRERESSQAELNRMILAKSRLEGLCREMQRQSRAVKEESLLRIKEEEEKRKEIANKFQATLNDISSLMQENSKKNIQLREENAQLATKLKGLVDNYEIWEQNMTKVVQQKELETQLAKAKHAKVNLLLKQETEKFLREKQSLLENLSELQKRCTVLTSNELQLRTELSDYTSKYEEFQSVLSNSSKVFSTFKNDMESTSKKIKKLEKETNVYKQKWESSNKALLDMISHKDKQDKDFSNAQQRILTLEKLCRALQAERNELRSQISVFSSNSVPTNNNSTDVSPLATEASVV